MKFKLLQHHSELKHQENGFFLIKTEWDDWFTYNTSYEVWIVDEKENRSIGTTKIGSFSMDANEERSPNLPTEFNELSNEFFSLGNDEAFYIELNRKENKVYRESLLSRLNDIALDENIHKSAKEYPVYKKSLTRFIREETINGRFRRLANGIVKLSNYHFNYRINDKSSKLEFKVEHSTLPPSNIHTIIGRNGVGKSYLLTEMVKSIITENPNFYFETESNDNFFTNILYVNFSTFENKVLPENNGDYKIKYYSLTPKNKIDDEEKYKFYNQNTEEIIPTEMDALFIESVTNCFTNKPRLWKESVNILYSDPVFKNLNIIGLYENFALSDTKNEYYRNAYNLFNKLSSGHKIVILTLTKLIELSEEKTLIIMDEPEMHLHPPLLGSFIRSISFLLNKVNGVSIMATHSPIIIQETQKNCVYKLNRDNEIHHAERPTIETFGEDIGTLTNEVFGLEVTESGFHTIIDELVKNGNSFEDSCRKLNNKIGSEGRAILFSKVKQRDEVYGDEVEVDE